MYPATLVLIVFVLEFFSASAQVSTPCLREMGNGNCLVKEGKHYGIKKKNSYVVPAFFDTIQQIGKNHYLIRNNNLYGLFNNSGKMEVPVAYSEIRVVHPDKQLFELIGNGNRSIFINQSLNKLRRYTPVKASLFASQTEVSMRDYLSMVQWQMDEAQISDLDWKSMLPDTGKMDPKTRTCIRYFYHQNDQGPAYEQVYSWEGATEKIYTYFSPEMKQDKEAQFALEYPITGITHQQAQWYCQLLSAFYSDMVNPFTGDHLAIRFRLPTISEWEEMALNGLPDESMKRNGRLDSLNAKGCQLFHYRFSFSCESITQFMKERGEGLALVNDYHPNHFGLHNIIGNAAEMVSDKGIAKGGSYFHYASKAKIDQHQNYRNPEPWLGFRPVAEIYLTE
jgi:formylglycine-generating enzyme required for sulfatase activity